MICDTPMKPEQNDAGAESIGEFLGLLLLEVVREVDAFSGKRPFGNSGWTYGLLVALADAGLITGTREVYPNEDVDDVEWEFTYEERRHGFELIEQAVIEKFELI